MTALRILLSSLRTAIAYPRVWLTLWLVVTVPALVAVYPVAMQIHDTVGTHPGASYAYDQALDADLARLHPEATVRLTGGLIFVLIAFTFFSGGILAGVGTEKRFTFTGMLADGGRLFLRNLRVLVVFVIAALLVFWGVGHLDDVIRNQWLYEWSPGAVSVFGWYSPWLTLEFALELLSWLWGLLFVGVVFVTKMAMARLAALDRRSALWAWLRAAAAAWRHPFRTGGLVLAWTLLLLLGSYGAGMLTVHFLEVTQQPWIGLAAGQLGMLWTQIMFVTALLAARALAFPPEPAEEVEEDETLSPPPAPSVRNDAEAGAVS